MTKQTLPFLTAIFSVLFAGPVLAAVSLDLVPIDNSGQLKGYHSFDLQFYTPVNDWTGTALLLELSAGSIYHAPLGGDGPMPSDFFNLVPTLEFDTYVGVPGGSIAGGAGDLDRSRSGAAEMSTAGLNVTFYNTANTDIGQFSIGRITLSDDAVGSWSLLTKTAGKYSFAHSGNIAEGIMEIDTETIQAPTITAVSVFNQADGSFLLKKYVTDSVREQAGNGFPGEVAYESAISNLMYNSLYEEVNQLAYLNYLEAERLETSFNFIEQYVVHYETYTYTEAEYLQSIGAIEAGSANPRLPEPGTMAVLGLGGMVLFRRSR